MLRLSIFAGAVIYVGLTVMSERSVANAEAAGDQATPVMRAKAAQEAAPATFVTADGRRLSIAAVINPSQRDGAQGDVPHVVTPRMADFVAPAAAARPTLPLAEVTGTRVNLRAGPSTGDPVLTALRLGDQVELIGATGDGWAQIRAIADGREGFMAIRFLTPLN